MDKRVYVPFDKMTDHIQFFTALKDIEHEKINTIDGHVIYFLNKNMNQVYVKSLEDDKDIIIENITVTL